MRPEIKQLANRLIDEYKDFQYEDSAAFCEHSIRHLGLCYFEYVEVLQYIYIGLDVDI